MICEFVFVVMVMGEPHYVGTFDNCGQAQLYQTLYLDKELESKCLHKEFIVLPSNFQHSCIAIHNFKGIDYGQGKQ